ncbi:heparinase II/III domain-containing protein [Phytoactinopolyspora halotolerans]|uniref:Heparinase II/III-like C-terminal domain-containing protein n=1 Tax=Phytoactinopolyspora halotolerans TaxID=1981512 RepID=A0A6L9S9K9_9ACTN|nr:heparinase II/III family protein [Phytoactinopolyspora halotolerans]NEE01916.1 hypothetical protein [Phytoactinopolyspora halotolerans]
MSGPRYDAAWTVLAHQAQARELRRRAHRYRIRGEAADRDRASELLDAYGRLYPQVAADGWSEQAEPWMLRGKLFSQALTEALWGTQIADAVRVLAAADPSLRGRLRDDTVDLLRGLMSTVHEARRVLVDERGDLRSNYTAWLDCAGGMAARALHALGEPVDAGPWLKGAFEQLAAAVGEDGWEWEGATYYHLFVLRAHLLNLAGQDPRELPGDAVARLAGMVRVLTTLATPAGLVPVLHDGPYRRDGALLELIEVCALARQLWTAPGVEWIEAYARRQLGDRHDGLEDLLDGWFAGPPLDEGIGTERGSVWYASTGAVVLRDPADTWQAVVDAGPHGGSHGHLDKLALYLYGADEPWQPAPGVPPYGSPLRRGHYTRTVAHPTVRIDGADQQPCTGTVLAWEPGPPARLLVGADDAFPGAGLRRAVIMNDEYLLDAVCVTVPSGAEHVVDLGLRPGGTLDIRTEPDGTWCSRWDTGGTVLHGRHVATAPSTLATVPGRGPSDDPAAVVAVADWTATCSATCSAVAFVSVYWPGDPGAVHRIELISTDQTGPARLRVEHGSGRIDEHTLEDT